VTYIVRELSSGNHFTVSSHCDLDLWPRVLKINRGHLSVMTNVPMNFPDPRLKRSSVIIRKPFTALSHCDLELWPSDLKINMGHLPIMINVPMKFHDPRRKRSWVIIRKPLGGRTVRRNMCKTIYPLVFEVGHKTHLMLIGNNYIFITGIVWILIICIILLKCIPN